MKKQLGNRGAAGELLVAADLIKQGYFVYRAVGPNGPFDLVAYRHGELLRIEVRVCAARIDGSLSPRMNVVDECDLYAFVGPDGGIEYQGSEQEPTAWSRKAKKRARIGQEERAA